MFPPFVKCNNRTRIAYDALRRPKLREKGKENSEKRVETPEIKRSEMKRTLLSFLRSTVLMDTFRELPTSM